nr:glycosyl hydrolase 53 family protein [Pectobacterium colocasium]
MEDWGVTWRDDTGAQRDVLQILRDHGINAVRLRIFVNPIPVRYGIKIIRPGRCSAIRIKLVW